MPNFLKNVISISSFSTEIKTKENNIWPIAWVTFLWSTASLMIFSIFPVFLSEELNVSNKAIGLLEGIAISTAFAAKVFSGVASDFFRKRKLFIVAGTTASVFTKLLFAFATTWKMVCFTRFIDRLAKGVRSAPTDALIANISNEDTATSNYSIKQALCALGTVAGSLIAMLLIWKNGTNFRLIFSLATIPAFLALLLLLFRVAEPKIITQNPKLQWKFSGVRQLPKFFWITLAITGILMTARFSEMFVALRAKETGWAIKYLPLLAITVDIFHAATSFINRKLAKRFGDLNLLILGFILLIAANFFFSTSVSYISIAVGAICNGLHLGLTQGILRAMVAKSCSQHLVGTAFSLFYLVSSFGVLIGNMLAGSLADAYGLHASFIGGMCITTLATVSCFVFSRYHRLTAQ